MKLCRLVLVASTACAGALLPSTMGAQTAASGTVNPPFVDEPVQIKEEIVRVDQTTPAVDTPPTRTTSPATERERRSSKGPRQSVRSRSARDNASSGVGARARRLFFGNGAVRPEPFPKPR